MHGVFKMKRILTLLLAVFVFFACTGDTGTNSKNENTSSNVVGWRGAGFTPVISLERGGGLQKVIHSGNWLVLMDAWTSPIEGKSGMWTTLTYSPRLFISKIETNVWDTLVPPVSANINNTSLYADSTGIYIGTSMTGQLLMYNPEKGEWSELNVIKKDNSAWSSVIGIQKFKGKLIVSIGTYPDTLNTKIVEASILLQKDTGWLNLPTPPIRYDIYSDNTVPLQFPSSVEMGGSLYVGTMDGVWELNAATLSWTELPKFPKMKWNSNYRDVYVVEDLIVYKGSLIAVDGTNDRVYQWDGSNNWLALDSMILPTIIRNGDSSYNIYRSSLRDIKDLATDGKHLFISGNASYPKVYMGDYGEPYGNVPKGWRAMMLGWCIEKKGCVSKDATYSLDIIGDTIYAAAWEGLFKMPLGDLDSAIAGQSDFKGFETYQYFFVR